MVQTKKPTKTKPTKTKPTSITEFKDNDLAPKGKIKHEVETDWPVKESSTKMKKRKVKKIEKARLP